MTTRSLVFALDLLFQLFEHNSDLEVMLKVSLGLEVDGTVGDNSALVIVWQHFTERRKQV